MAAWWSQIPFSKTNLPTFFNLLEHGASSTEPNEIFATLEKDIANLTRTVEKSENKKDKQDVLLRESISKELKQSNDEARRLSQKEDEIERKLNTGKKEDSLKSHEKESAYSQKPSTGESEKYKESTAARRRKRMMLI